jgi:hypothetical protein
MFFHDGDDDKKDDKKTEEPNGGPEAGDYTPSENVPGKSEGLDNSEQ